MARSSTVDPVEKFRFVVTIFEDSGAIFGSSQSFNTDKSSRAGFTSATSPKVAVTEILHRENIDGNRPIKVAGLAKYEPVSLRRGSTSNKELYNWYKLVNDDVNSLNRFSEAISGLGAVPFNEPRYRKDVMVSSIDRTGKFVKHWFLVNAWPSEYSGGDDFDAATEAILIENLTLSYESFVEVTGDTINAAIQSVQSEAEESTRRQAASGIISTIFN